MGAKAKQAITQAASALSDVENAAKSLETNYKALHAANKTSVEFNIAAATKRTDVKSAKTDQDRRKIAEEVLKLEQSWETAHARCAQLRGACRDDMKNVRASAEPLKAALKTLETMIIAKYRKRNESKNVVKKLVNMAKTKSLGDLMAENDRIVKAVKAIEVSLMGIDPYWFKD